MRVYPYKIQELLRQVQWMRSMHSKYGSHRTNEHSRFPRVQEAAQKAIEQADIIRLSLADQECFAHALLSPPEPAPALKRAFARRQKLLQAP